MARILSMTDYLDLKVDLSEPLHNNPIFTHYVMNSDLLADLRGTLQMEYPLVYPSSFGLVQTLSLVTDYFLSLHFV